jgi:ADP-heptose:LPS heptosyltransferase
LSPSRILIIRRDNIGDLICTTPLFAALREKYPQAYIAALVNSYNEPAIAGNPSLDAIFSYTKGKHAAGESVWQAYLRRVRLIWQLRRMKFDYILLPNGGFAARALKLASLLAPHHIIGFVGDQSSPKIDLPIPHGEGGKLHETEDVFRLLEPLGVSGEIPQLTVTADASLAAIQRQKLPEHIAQVVVRHFEHQFVVHLQHQRDCSLLASSQSCTAIIASLIRSAAVPCIGALIAARSAPWRRPAWLARMSGSHRRRPNTVST